MRQARCVACMRETRNVYNILIGKDEAGKMCSMDEGNKKCV
jgi:hypothetical protein